MSYQLFIFDFDGTLADSFPFFVEVFNDLARKHGFRCIEAQEVQALREHGAREVMKRVGMPAWKLPMVSASFIGLMKAQTRRIPLFEGMEAVLRQLAGAGVKLAVVSSNAEDNVRAVLGPELAGLIAHYECGMSIFGKASRIRRVLAATGTPAARALCVGDQVTDLEASRAEGVPFAAVAWGYGTPQSLAAHKPQWLLNDVRELVRLA
ncbi:HAD hydrolase-like protein [Azohydromonas caseinilytica]|uniref:HAD hydrolase-like protein n=1 Tax=Azohydromonas caseinilytica TaxID=2728836 RepID=A0A848FJB4_9BURK|nr:HAD hydrolase-like protein [Azohydromonas caseinilytica]NML18399.1 HAD hydrolase-like protein [Azohydromonas caseinilytica]